MGEQQQIYDRDELQKILKKPASLRLIESRELELSLVDDCDIKKEETTQVVSARVHKDLVFQLEELAEKLQMSRGMLMGRILESTVQEMSSFINAPKKEEK